MKYNYLSLLTFITGMLLGYIFFDFIKDYFAIRSNTDNIPNLYLFEILKNNFKLILILIFGSFTFGLVTIINLIYNGIYFSFFIINIYTIDPKLLYILLPHSTEIIGYILAGSIGLELSNTLFNFVFYNNFRIRIKKLTFKMLISLFIIFISAFIEVSISPYIIN